MGIIPNILTRTCLHLTISNFHKNNTYARYNYIFPRLKKETFPGNIYIGKQRNNHRCGRVENIWIRIMRFLYFFGLFLALKRKEVLHPWNYAINLEKWKTL